LNYFLNYRKSTGTDDMKRVPVRCPVPPGIVFYGVVPAPPPPSMISTNKDQRAPFRLCANLVSSADYCTAGQMGPVDQMKYTVSECIEQDSSNGTSQTDVEQQTIFEGQSIIINIIYFVVQIISLSILTEKNNNNNDYYYCREWQQHYPPPPPDSTGMDNNYYYIQKQQQQHWQQQHP